MGDAHDRPVPTDAAGAVAVLTVDPGLGAGLAGAERRRATAAAWAQTVRVPRGPWTPATAASGHGGWFGLLLLDGLLARHVAAGPTAWTELLGPGDVVRPWTVATEATSTEPAVARYEALEPAWLAILDRDFAVRVAPWPEIAADVVGRAVERSRWLTHHLATSGRSPIDDRLWRTLWQLADRFGRATPDGAELALPHLTHEALATLLGTRRPTVSSALSRLEARGLLTRRRRGHWVLHGDPGADSPPQDAPDPGDGG